MRDFSVYVMHAVEGIQPHSDLGLVMAKLPCFGTHIRGRSEWYIFSECECFRVPDSKNRTSPELGQWLTGSRSLGSQVNIYKCCPSANRSGITSSFNSGHARGATYLTPIRHTKLTSWMLLTRWGSGWIRPGSNCAGITLFLNKETMYSFKYVHRLI